MENPQVRVYLDDEVQPIVDRELPTEISLDTTNLADGPHRLTIRAQDQWGREGVEEIPFGVHNGPGIIVSGLSPHSKRRGKVLFRVDSFSADDPFGAGPIEDLLAGGVVIKSIDPLHDHLFLRGLLA